MMTYCLIKEAIDNSFGYDDLAACLLLMVLAVIFDLLFIILQPLFYILVRKWEIDN